MQQSETEVINEINKKYKNAEEKLENIIDNKTIRGSKTKKQSCKINKEKNLTYMTTQGYIGKVKSKKSLKN